MRVAAIIVAAGRGLRAGGGTPKQYRRLGAASALERTLAAFGASEGVGVVQAVIHPSDTALYADALSALPGATRAKLLEPVPGGTTRQGSVLAGLEALAELANPPELVLVHDAARPYVSASLISRAIAAGAATGAAIPGVPVTDTIKRVDEAGRVLETPPRERLRPRA